MTEGDAHGWPSHAGLPGPETVGALVRGGEVMSMNIELTTESSMSSHGQLMLRIRTDDSIED